MRTLFVALSLTVCAGCSMPTRDYVNIETGSAGSLGKYMTFQHPFSDAAAEKVRQQAERHCGQTKLVAVRTRGVCSMTECTTDYQCMTSEESARVAPADVKKP